MFSRRWAQVGLILMVVGVAVLVWPACQYLLSHFRQVNLMAEFDEAIPVVTSVVPDEYVQQDRQQDRVAPAGDYEEEELVDEGPFIILIRKLQLRAAVVDGVTAEELASGPGFYTHSPRPGQPGNVAIAGHRNSHGAWFRDLNELEKGDTIILQSPRATYLYSVESVFVVERDAWEVVYPTDEPKLTLTTCHPIGSVEQRLIVRADYVGMAETPLDSPQ